MDSGAKNRVRLWLRSERALGLPAVGAPPVVDASAAQPQDLQPEPETAPPVEQQAPVLSPSAIAAPETVPAEALFAPDAALRAFDAPALDPDQKRERLVAMDEREVRGCTKCRLCETRTKTVFGEGDPDAGIFFIGEGPGENEDLQGRPFVGRAGEMLNKWIGAMGLRREQVYISNIVKCRPPNNRVPAPDEVATCTPYLQRQLEIIRPKAIVTLGLPAAKYMLQSTSTMGKLRGRWHEWRGIKLMPTYHPAYVLRNATYETRAAVWDDLKKVMAELDLPLPK
jgi:DNA polymerase